MQLTTVPLFLNKIPPLTSASLPKSEERGGSQNVTKCLANLDNMYALFVQRYRCISSHVDLSSPDQRENVSQLLKLLDKIEPESFQFGKTKVKFKNRKG